MLLVLFSMAAMADVSEERIQNIRFSGKEDVHLMSMEHAIVKDSGIQMRVSADRGSLIEFNNVNVVNEWSFEFMFKNLNLNYPEAAGIYLWYTDEKVKSGHFNGIDGDFSGLMTGIEFLGRGLEIVLGTNDGKEIPHYTEDVVVLRDSVNPGRFRNVDNFRVKVISTEKNYKVEIYNDNELVYDNLRFIETPILGPRGGHKYFSISTQYHKVPMDKMFVLKNIQAYIRTENDAYDPYKIHSEQPSEVPRYGTDIEHPSKEVQHMISAVEHMMAYLKNILGIPGGSTVIENTLDAKNAAITLQTQIRGILSNIEQMSEQLRENGTTIIGAKLGNLEIDVRNLKRSIFETQHIVNDWGTRINKMHNKMLLLFLAAFAVYIVLFMLTRRRTEDPHKKDI